MKKNVIFIFMPIAAALFIWACGEAEISKDFADMDAKVLLEKCIKDPNPTDPALAAACESMLTNAPNLSSPGSNSSSSRGVQQSNFDKVTGTISCNEWANRGLDKNVLYIGDNIDPIGTGAVPNCEVTITEGQEILDSLECKFLIKVAQSDIENDPNGGTLVPSTITSIPDTFGKWLYVTTWIQECGNDRLRGIPQLVYEIRDAGIAIDGNCTFYNGNTAVANPIKWTSDLIGQPPPSLKLSLMGAEDYENCTINGISISDENPLDDRHFELYAEPQNSAPDFPGRNKPNTNGYTYKYRTGEGSCEAADGSDPIPIPSRECTLVVNDGSCYAKNNMNDLCPGISYDDIDWNANKPFFNNTGNATPQKGCYYLEDIATCLNTSGGGYRINGVEQSKNYYPYEEDGTPNATYVAPVDGGYYVYLPNNTENWMWPNGACGIKPGNSKPACVYNELTCALPSGEVTAGSTNNTAFNNGVKCGGSTGIAPTGTIKWYKNTDTEITNWNNESFGTLNNVYVEATCNGSTEKIKCGTGTIDLVPGANLKTPLTWENVRPNGGGNGAKNTSGIFFNGDKPQFSGGVGIGALASACNSYKYVMSWATGTNVTSTPHTSATAVNTGATDTEITVTASCATNSGTVQLGKITAKVVPDPSLEGTCEWNAKGDNSIGYKFSAGTRAKVKTDPTPKDLYGRTCNIYYAQNEVNKGTLTQGLQVDALKGNWTANSQKMENLSIKISCGGAVTDTKACQKINVWDPNQMCEFDDDPSFFCPGFTNISNVKAESYSGNLNDGARCYYATSISMFGNTNGTGLINGVQVSCGNTGWGQQTCADALKNIDKYDGGYYIYFPGYASDLNWTNSGGLNVNCR